MLQYIGNSSWLSNSVLKERGLKKQLCSVHYIFPTSGPRTYVSVDTRYPNALLVREHGCQCEVLFFGYILILDVNYGCSVFDPA